MPASAAPTMAARRSERSWNCKHTMQDGRFTQSPSLRYITRSDTERYWRVQYARGLAKPISVYFGDATYGGREEALAEAQRFRDQVVAQQNGEALREQRRNVRHKDKTAPYVGINLHVDRKRGRAIYLSWRASYMERDQPRSRSWSVIKYGYEEAFRLASEYRHRMTGQPIGVCPPLSPELLDCIRRQ